jgi:hypothetical protein
MLLACEPTANFETFSTVWVGITKAGNTKWAQMGITRRRNAGTTAILQYIKCETKAGPTALDYDNTIVPPVGFPAFPAIGTTHDYECVLTQATGKWEYFYDGRSIHQFTRPGWIGDVGNKLDCVGEVYDLNSRMAGDSATKCRITNIRYKAVTLPSSSSSSRSSSSAGAFGVVGPYVSPAFGAGNILVTNNTQHGSALVSGSSIEIWDKNP